DRHDPRWSCHGRVAGARRERLHVPGDRLVDDLAAYDPGHHHDLAGGAPSRVRECVDSEVAHDPEERKRTDHRQRFRVVRPPTPPPEPEAGSVPVMSHRVLRPFRSRPCPSNRRCHQRLCKRTPRLDRFDLDLGLMPASCRAVSSPYWVVLPSRATWPRAGCRTSCSSVRRSAGAKKETEATATLARCLTAAPGSRNWPTTPTWTTTNCAPTCAPKSNVGCGLICP